MDSTWNYLVGRMQEPSTWVSLGSLFTAVGFAVAPEYWQAISTIGMGLGGLIGTILSERKMKKSDMKAAAEEVVVDNVKEGALTNGLREKVDAANRN